MLHHALARGWDTASLCLSQPGASQYRQDCGCFVLSTGFCLMDGSWLYTSNALCTTFRSWRWQLAVQHPCSLAAEQVMHGWGEAHEGPSLNSLSPSSLLPGSLQICFSPTSSSLLLIFFLFVALHLLARSAAHLMSC